jgi:ubiquinone/menaquinone biosynthesis C-methylase UbiE
VRHETTFVSYSDPQAYERFMGRWSARLAPRFARFAGVGDGQRILDVGCGTGSLAAALLRRGDAVSVVGIDPSPPFVAHAQRKFGGRRAHFHVGSVADLPSHEASFDATLALLVLQEFPNPDDGVRHMIRVTRPGGTVASCLWDFRDGMPMLSLFWQAAEAVAPDAVKRRRALNPTPFRPDLKALAEMWVQLGLSEVRATGLAVTMEFSSFDDFWRPFAEGATPVAAFAATLDRETDGALARRLRADIPAVQPCGSFVLTARAWSVVGFKPGRRP